MTVHRGRPSAGTVDDQAVKDRPLTLEMRGREDAIVGRLINAERGTCTPPLSIVALTSDATLRA